MNERIQKLAEEANCNIDGMGYGEGNLEKFAELIVQECGVALSPMLRDMVSRGQAYDIIKEHFGVEE